MRFLFDDLTIDTNTQKVWRGQQLLDISGLNFRFLSYMLTKEVAIVTFDELIERVWAPAIVNEDTVTQRVRLLRTALADDGRNPRYIRSVRGQGYQLVVAPRVLNDAAELSPPQSRFRRFALLSAAGIAAVSLLIAWGLNWQNHSESSSVLSPQNATVKLLERAKYYASIGQHDNNDRAIELFERVLTQEPDNIDAMLGLSRSYTRDMCRFNADWQQAERAEGMARAVLELEPNNFHAFRLLGYSQDCRGQSQAAEAAYLRAIELDPDDDLNSQFSLAYLLGEKGQLAEALALNLAVSRQDPGQTYSLIQIARVYELLGLHPIAERFYKESFALYPDNIFSNVAYPRNLFYQGRFSEARDILIKAKQRPAHPDLFVLSAELALLNNNISFAQQELTHASQLRPWSAYYDLLAKLYDPSLNPQQWVADKFDYLQYEVSSNDAGNWIKRAMLHQAQGDLVSGMDALSTAVEFGFRNSAYLQLSPLFEKLRSASGFEQVMATIDTAVQLELDRVYAEGLTTGQFARQ